LFPGGGPPGTGGSPGFGRAIAPGGTIGPGVPINNPGGVGVGGGVVTGGVLRPRTNLPYYNFATVIPGPVWSTPGNPVVSYPMVDGNYYGYEPPQAQFINNYSPGNNGNPGNGQGDQQPVVIVNQYFRPDQAPAPQANAVAPQQAVAAAPAAVVTNNKSDQPYFLIAMKDSTIYAASAYWVEDNTLNYLTLQGNENQVSLDLVDRELSQRLNRDRSVAFGLPR
jgi:hypothetical protein